jgi:hypothetical protein
MPFQIINVNEAGSVVLGEDGQPLSFEDGRAAAAAAAELAAKDGGRYQPRRAAVDENIWKQRERARFDAGNYRKPLFATEDWFTENIETRDHFLHVSNEEPSKIAFTESPENGQADRQTRMKVGRYLERFFSGLPRDYREQLVRAHQTEFVTQALNITTDAEKIEWVYTHGPHSCMAYPRTDGHFSFHDHHPTAVYAGPDLAVAYLMSAHDEDRVAARAVVWPERKVFSRVYGDMLLHSVLIRQGWTEGSLDGARLQKIELPRGNILMAYLDCEAYASDEGDFLRINRNLGELACRNTSGYASRLNVRLCPCCNERRRDDGYSFRLAAMRFDIVGNRARPSRDYVCQACSTDRNRVIRVERHDTLALRSLTVVRDGHRYFVGEYEAIQAARAATQARVQVAPQPAATTAPRRPARVNPETFVCACTGQVTEWRRGCNVYSINHETGRHTFERWSIEAANAHTTRCDQTHRRYRSIFITQVGVGFYNNTHAATLV